MRFNVSFHSSSFKHFVKDELFYQLELKVVASESKINLFSSSGKLIFPEISALNVIRVLASIIKYRRKLKIESRFLCAGKNEGKLEKH